jgi:hypothetical protein
MLLSLNGADGRVLSELELQDMETNPAAHALGWDCPSSGCGSPVAGERWIEKNGAWGAAGGPRVNTSIAIFGGRSIKISSLGAPNPYLPGAVAVLFVNSNNTTNTDVSKVLSNAFASATKPKP